MTAGETVREDPRPCVSYLRVSTKRQGESGLGEETQREAVDGFLRRANCAELVAEFVEVDSGKNDDRPELKRALAKARNLRGRLIVAKLDRLGRRAATVLRLLDEAVKDGVDVVIVDRPHADPMMLGIEAVWAEEGGKRISRRTKAALAAKKVELAAKKARLEAEGAEVDPQHFNLGNPNLTNKARAKGRRVAAARKRARANRRAEDLRNDVDELRGEGRTSLRQLAEGLEERGCLTPGGKSSWSPTQVSRLLKRLDG